MKTILVVDDFASVRLYHSRFLTQKGFHCVEACNGAEALEVVQRQHVDLVLLDMIMPDMDGAMFLMRLRSMEAFRALPVLAITSEALKENTRRLHDTHGIHVLLKPLLPDELHHKVLEALGAKHN